MSRKQSATEYAIGGIRGFDLSTYMKAMKTKYDLFELYLRDNRATQKYDPNGALLQESWDDIKPITVQEAFEERNIEKRRILFSCIGPAKMFKEIHPDIVDVKKVKMKNRVWDKDGKESVVEIEDVYELYELDEDKLFGDVSVPRNSWRRASTVKLKIVRCWCTTTGREYWIFVDDPVAAGRSVYTHLEDGRYGYKKPISDALDAIAWTFRVGIKKEDIEEIYRQGDCLVIKAKQGAQALPRNEWYHLDGKTYVSKLAAQS